MRSSQTVALIGALVLSASTGCDHERSRGGARIVEHLTEVSRDTERVENALVELDRLVQAQKPITEPAQLRESAGRFEGVKIEFGTASLVRRPLEVAAPEVGQALADLAVQCELVEYERGRLIEALRNASVPGQLRKGAVVVEVSPAQDGGVQRLRVVDSVQAPSGSAQSVPLPDDVVDRICQRRAPVGRRSAHEDHLDALDRLVNGAEGQPGALALAKRAREVVLAAGH